jgi:hypothetical protein
MYIEDLILKLNSSVKVNSYDQSIVNSFATQLFGGRGFTEKQSTLAIKILKKYQKNLELAVKSSVSQYLDNPQFRFLIRTNAKPVKRVYIDDYLQWGRCIKVEFPYSEDKVAQIRKHRDFCNLIFLFRPLSQLAATIFDS